MQCRVIADTDLTDVIVTCDHSHTQWSRLIAANPAVVTDISGSGRTALIEAAVRETGPVRLQ